MKQTSKLAILALMGLAVSMPVGMAAAGEQTYEAVIRFTLHNTGHVTIEARDWFTAKDQIQNRYCGGTDCIVEGPWSLPATSR